MVRLLPFKYFILLCFLVLPLEHSNAQSVGTPGPLESEVLALINQARSERGLDQVSFSPLLAAAAQRHSRDMANGRFVNNTGSDGSRTTDRIVQAGYRYDRATEMVAAHATDARTVVQLWLGSSENGAGLLKRDVSEVGIGVSPARTGAPKTEPGPYWTVTFARPVPTLVALSQIRDRTLALINATRVRNGLATLSYDPILNVAAEIHAADMARVDFMDHTGSDRSSPADRAARAGYPSPNIVLENVAQGTIGADDTVKGWFASPGHRRNMLDPRVTSIGLAVVDGENLNGGDVLRRYWALSLGAVR